MGGRAHPKVRARLRREHAGHVSGKRVLCLLRQEGLLAPQRARGRRNPVPMTARSSRRRPASAGAATPPWPGPAATGGCGCSPASTTTPPRPGRMWPRWVTASPPSSRSTTRSPTAGASSAQTSPAGCSCGMTGDPNIARPTAPARWPGSDHRQPGVPGRAGDQRLRRALDPHVEGPVPVGPAVRHRGGAPSGRGQLRRPLQHLVAHPTPRSPHSKGGLPGGTISLSSMTR